MKIKARVGYASREGSLCGFQAPRQSSLKVDGRPIEVTFKSDSSFTANGFKISYRAYGRFMLLLKHLNHLPTAIGFPRAMYILAIFNGRRFKLRLAGACWKPRTISVSFGSHNRPFQSSCLPPLQSESKCKVFVMVISSTLHTNENYSNFIRETSHLDSL